MSFPELFPGFESVKNIHPMFVHLPLGLWPVAFAFFVLGVARHVERLLEVGRWLLYVATAAAIATTISGWFAAEGLGHESPGHDLVHIHRNWMLAATGLSILTSAIAFALRHTQSTAKLWAITAAFALTLAVATLGADRGAYLVFGKGVGVVSTTTHQGQPNPDSEHHHGR